MMRYRGRVQVLKVDEKGNKIKNFKSWLKKNPNKDYFDSYPEWEVWKYIKDNNIDYKSQVTIELFDGIHTEEFTRPRQTKKAKAEGRKDRIIKSIKQKGIAYTPDYYLPEFDVYIEVKGYADDLFKLRWKLFKLNGYHGFIVYSLDEFKELYKQLKERNDIDTR